MGAPVLPNADINELSPGIIQPEDLLPFWSKSLGQTLSVKAKDLVPTDDDNFNWSSTESYDTNEVVTYGGQWWQSQIDDNVGNVPGEDITKWVSVPGSVGFTWWKAGVYSQTKTLVVNDYSGDARWFALAGAVPVPFVSSDFQAELAANKWVPITEKLGAVAANNVANVINLDLTHHSELTFHVLGGGIGANAEFTLSNDIWATHIIIHCLVNAEGVQLKFPNTFKSNDSANWDSATQTWTLPEGNTGDVLIEAFNYGGVWLVKFLTQFV